MAWHQLSVISEKNITAEISDFFIELSAVSVTFMAAENLPIYEPNPREIKIWHLTKVIALFELNVDPANIKTALYSRFQNLSLASWSQEILQDQVWELSWKQYYQPMKFAELLWVCPTGQEIITDNSVCLIMDPGLAFGTGTHATTALCLNWLATHKIAGKTIIDYGCGSGILAVAGLLLGAKKAFAVDIDPQAITATLANAEKNHVKDKIKCFLPEQLPVLKADIVIANILAKPLCQLSETLSTLINPNGKLILSGVLNEQASSVMNAYQQHNIKFLAPIIQGDWCRLEGDKSH